MKLPNILLAFTLVSLSSLHAEERTVVFADDFENRTELGAEYSVTAEWPDSFKIKGGILVAKQDNPNHGAVLRKDIAFKDLDLEFDFRFSGGQRFNVVINDQKDKSVWSGHICRVSLSPKKLTIGDDKTGSMNLEVRAQRQDKNLSAEKKTALEARLAATQVSADVDLKPGEWHHLRVRIEGDTMDAWIAGTKVATLRSPGFVHATKTSFGFTVTGTSIDFDNLKVFETTK